MVHMLNGGTGADGAEGAFQSRVMMLCSLEQAKLSLNRSKCRAGLGSMHKSRPRKLWRGRAAAATVGRCTTPRARTQSAQRTRVPQHSIRDSGFSGSLNDM